MANPFAFNDPFGDPFGSSNPFMPKRAPASASLPTLTPEEEQSLLGSVMEEGIGGLGYVGKILDKTFGGRAVRGGLGLLTGQNTDPSELLSFLPMSDTLGLTKERNAVQGTDLLANAGLITPGDTGWQNQLAGVGTEIALDPATYLGAPAIKAVAGLYGKGASGLGRLASAPISLATGGAVDPFAFGARVGGNLLEKGTAAGRALFDRPTQGTWLPPVQDLARNFYTPRLDAGLNEARMAHAEAMVPLKKVIGSDLKLQDEIGRAIQTRAEGFGSSADARLQAAGLDPAQIQDVYGTVDPFLGRVKSTIGTEQGVGSGTREFADIPQYVSEANDAAHAAGNALPYPQDLPFPNYQPAEYFPRTLAQYPESEGFFRSASNRLSGNTGFQKSREDIFRGIPGGTNMIEDLVRNPELSGKARTLSDLDVEDRLTTLLSNKRPGLVPLDDPVRAQAASLGDYLKSLPEVSQQRGLFSSDALGAGLSRLEESARVKASGETILEGIGRFARPVADLEREGVKHVRVPDMINAAGLDYVDPVTKMPVAADRAATRLGLTGPAATSELRNYAVPADVAQDMARMGQAFKVPESIAPVVAAWDSLTNFFKTSLTTLFPAFHTRNGMSGLFNMWRDSALDTKALGSAANVIRGGLVDAETAAKVYNTTPEAATQELLKEVMGKRLAFTRNNQTSDAVGAVRRGLLPSDVPEVGTEARPIAEDIGNWMKGFGPGDRPMSEAYNPLNIAGVRGDTDVFRPVAQGRAVGNSVEDFLRMGHYLGKRRAGFGVDDAAESVAKYQLDYSELSSFEKGVMKRVMPWYSFSRRSLPVLLEDLATKPAKLAGSIRVATGVRQPYDFIPNYIAEGASAPVPGAPDGQQRYLSSLGLPFEDELVKTAGSALKGDLSRTLQQAFGMAQPLVKLPAEVATGTQMYSGRKLEDLKPYEFSQLGGLIPEDRARQVSQIIANSPASRFGSSFDKVLDDRKGVAPTLLNLLSGVRVTDVDAVQQRDLAAREALKNALYGMPGVRSRTDIYIPSDQLEGLDPQTAYLYSLLRKENKTVSDMQNAKKKQAQSRS